MAAKKTAKKSARKPNAAFNKPLKPSAALAAIVGSKPLSRGAVTKKIWAYVKKNKLQVPTDLRSIKPDAKLAKVFGGKGAISMFTMTKKVSKHLS